MKMNKIILAVLILSMIASIFSSCGGGGWNPVTPPPEEEPIEPIVPETTKVVEEETIEEIVSITEDQSTIVFEKSTPQLEELASGDIIAMGVTKNTPEGLLRKVKNITKGAKDSGEVIVETEFATLEEAIEQGEFYFSESLKSKDAKEPVCYVKGVEFIRDKSTIKDSKINILEFNYNINAIIYDEDNNPNTEGDNITLNGQLSFDYNLLFSGKIGFPHKLKELNFQNIVEVEKNLGVTVGGSVKLFSYKKVLWTHPLGIKVIMIGYLPIVLSPKITISANVDGEIFAELTAEVTDTNIYTAGVKFDNGSWQPISNHEDSYTPPSLSLSTGGAVTFGVGPKLECKVDGVVGPYCETSLYGKVIADIYENPWWKIYVGIIAKAGVKIGIFSKVFASADLTILDLQKIIKQADGPFGGANNAPVISSLTADPSSININETTTITCTASDEDVGDILTYAWSKNGGIFEGSTSGSSVTWRAPSTAGSYTVTCEVSDGEASDSEQVVITINPGSTNHPPDITSSPVTFATKGQPYSYDVNATDSDGDIPVYSLTTNPSGMTINSSTGLISWTPGAIGNYNVTVKVSDGELFDTQSFTITVESTTTTDKPDLIVSNIWTEPNPPIAAGFTTIGIEIKNQGNVDAIGTFFLEFYFDGTYQGHVYINGLNAGSTNTSYWQAVTWPSDINLHTIKGVADPDNIINESSESNNQYSIQVKATEPPVGTGTLKIESVPGIAKVYIAGIYKGETPSSGYLTISDLTAGDHGLKVTKSGYEDWIGVVTIPSGSTQYKAVILELITPKPDPPTFLSPGTTSAPGPIISTLTPTLQWQAVPNADYYNLSVSIYPYGTSNIIYYNQQVYGNSITVPSGKLEAGNKYRWNMRAYNSAGGYSDYSLDYYFQTGTTIGQVQLSGPSNGGTLPPMSVTFWWNSVSNATKYQFILYNQQGQVALDTIKTSTSLIVALGTEETITWKVRAGDDSGNWGAWSSTWSLTIKK